MKSRPILFSAPMVRALLAGAKTQTRRVMKTQPNAVEIYQYASGPQAGEDYQVFRYYGDHPKWSKCASGWTLDCPGPFACPYGKPGDRLWVKESYRLRRISLDGAEMDGVRPNMFTDSTRWFEADGKATGEFGKLRPSIHMPRWASRITLEITGVRVERLQEINAEDAKAEGCEYVDDGRSMWMVPGVDESRAWTGPDCYRALWQSINGPGSWDANPWVWVVEFKRVQP